MRTETTLRRLLTELDLPWETGMLEHYGREAASVVTNGETWKANVGRRIRPATSPERELTPDQRQLVDRLLNPDLYRMLADGVIPRPGTVVTSD